MPYPNHEGLMGKLFGIMDSRNRTQHFSASIGQQVAQVNKDDSVLANI